MAGLPNLPLISELPSEFSERLGQQYAIKEKAERKKEKGQFFTPVPIARLMANMAKVNGKVISILDPGCGTGVLTAALVEKLVVACPELESISVTAYETDPTVLPFAEATFQYLQNWLLDKGISFTYKVLDQDFVLANAAVLNANETATLFQKMVYNGPFYDLVITNPPYFKLNKEDHRVAAAARLVSGHPNIYALFLGIAAHLLKQGGEMISITPRSFASGQYFKAFRHDFFQTVRLKAVHLFQSRKDTFGKDSVLQETVVLKVCRQRASEEDHISLSSSFGLRDLENPDTKSLPVSELLNLHSSEKILYLPVSADEERILGLVGSWKNTLRDFHIQISTGPVVAFRAEAFIHQTYTNGSVQLVPLIWMHHVGKMNFEWPKAFKEKGQYIRSEPASRSLLLPNKDYILLRRFSTKDDKSRLIAAPYFARECDVDGIGIENKVNYLYRKGGKLETDELVGLSALLNSRLFNDYFQMFNGNVNVSATELREMKFPPLEDIKILGNRLLMANDFEMATIDELVKEMFEKPEPVNG